MDVAEAVKALETHKLFKEWKTSHKDGYLSSAFTMVENQQHAPWQLGYYNPDSNKIATFIIEGSTVAAVPEEEIFQKKEKRIREVALPDVKLSLPEAVEKADGFQQKTYPRETVLKRICILQNLDKLGPIWNFTFVTQAFNALNIKLSAADGKILSHHITSLMDMGKFT